MYFRLGGGTIKGVCTARRNRLEPDLSSMTACMKMDLGRAGVAELPMEETQRRWDATTPQWPIMHAVTYGITRDQMIARHKANHIQVAYAHSEEEADKALLAKASMAQAMGMHVAICGSKRNGKKWK